jgi:hypothetical protein
MLKCLPVINSLGEHRGGALTGNNRPIQSRQLSASTASSPRFCPGDKAKNTNQLQAGHVTKELHTYAFDPVPPAALPNARAVLPAEREVAIRPPLEIELLRPRMLAAASIAMVRSPLFNCTPPSSTSRRTNCGFMNCAGETNCRNSSTARPARLPLPFRRAQARQLGPRRRARRLEGIVSKLLC